MNKLKKKVKVCYTLFLRLFLHLKILFWRKQAVDE